MLAGRIGHMARCEIGCRLAGIEGGTAHAAIPWHEDKVSLICFPRQPIVQILRTSPIRCCGVLGLHQDKAIGITSRQGTTRLALQLSFIRTDQQGIVRDIADIKPCMLAQMAQEQKMAHFLMQPLELLLLTSLHMLVLQEVVTLLLYGRSKGNFGLRILKWLSSSLSIFV